MPAGGALPGVALPEQVREAIGRAIAASRSPNTRRSYQVAWRAWESWARGRGYQALPARAETIAAYLTERAAAGAGASTLGTALAAIAAAHGAAGEPDPDQQRGRAAHRCRAQARGRRRRAAPGQAAHRDGPGRDRGEHPAHGARPHGARALPHDARRAAAALGGGRAHLGGPSSRPTTARGRLTIRRAKGDQEGRGAVVYLGTAALRALEALRPAGAGPDAPVFASPRAPGQALSESAISRAIERAARRAGLGDGFSGHSPRIGMALDLSRAGMATHAIQQAGRWASPAMVVRYTRSESAGRGAVAAFYGAQR